MEFLPALAPVVGDLAGRDLNQGLAHCGGQVGERRQLSRRSVDGVLDRLAPVGWSLFDARGRQLEQRREDKLRLGARHAQREANHAAWLPRARRSLANIPSWSAEVLLREAVPELLEQLALLGVQASGYDDVDDHPQVSLASSSQPRHALPAEREDLPRLGPGGDLDG